MKNRVIAVLLAASLVPGIAACGSNAADTSATSAPAAESTATTIDRATAEKNECKEAGVTFYLPSEYQDLKGFYAVQSDDSTFGPGIYYATCNYSGVTQEWLSEAMQNEETAQEAIKKYQQSTVPVFTMVAINNDRGAQELVDAINNLFGATDSEDAAKVSDLKEIAKNEGVTYFKLLGDHSDNYKNLDAEFAAEYDKLEELADAVLENADYYKPVGVYDEVVGQKISFETTDLDGNKVTSDELFAKYDVTMVNAWGTWCHWCVEELPELQKISERLAGKNCAIVGFCGDAVDDETVALAKKQLEEAGCTYLCLRPFDGWEKVFTVNGWPTSFFFDSKGVMASTPIVGAAVDRYEGQFDDILSGEATTEAVVDNATANNENAYRIYVVDQNSKPVVGAMVQFCTDDTCKLGKTDENGVASFDDPEGVYQVHVLKVPAGYKANEELYATPNTYSDLVIVVETE